jgi:PAS domain S-box-containing protein
MVDLPFALVMTQVLLVLPMLLFIWWTAKHLSATEAARLQAQRAFDRVRVEAEGIAARAMETSNLLDGLWENAPVGVAIIDRNLRYVRVNPFLAETNGLPAEQHRGRTLRELFPEQADRFEVLLEAVFAEGRSIEGIETFASTPGAPDTPRCYNCEMFPVPDRFNNVSLVGMVVTEITEQKQIEAQRATLLETERTARAEAERVGMMKDEFLATLSHELRTPLTSIMGWAQLLRAKAFDAQQVQRGLETIDRNSKALSQLINDLLDVSRIINGKLHLNMASVNVQAVVGAALDSVAPSAEAKGLHLVRAFDDTPLTVHGDASRLQQVVWNLLTNAVKFTPRDGTIRVSLRRVGDEVEIEVADTGIGVKREFLAHMFERFRQADSSTTRHFGGLGLGLSIVRQLAELHAGHVRVSSDGPGLGTSFVVTLPLLAIEDNQPPVINPAPSSTISLTGYRILIVDDEPDTRLLLSSILAEAGATVSLADSVDEAMLRVELDQPQLLISDVGMPSKDGYELIAMVRRRYPPARLPAIALTALAGTDDRERSLEAGYQIHLAKPVTHDGLLETVAGVLRESAHLSTV